MPTKRNAPSNAATVRVVCDGTERPTARGHVEPVWLGANLFDRLCNETRGELDGVLNRLLDHALTALHSDVWALKAVMLPDLASEHLGTVPRPDLIAQRVPRSGHLLVELFGPMLVGPEDHAKNLRIDAAVFERMSERTAGNRNGIVNLLAIYALDDLQSKGLVLRATPSTA
ncbi:hypothetical protein [Burkholderia vietnamiensis]|uniref:hypothetical protein n=1 Tax=Burkholderia vietnamiensis TaxID=60552 RepID=UPI001594A740|nr:hypothetical protein [Burkholderia vietnamiensis]